MTIPHAFDLIRSLVRIPSVSSTDPDRDMGNLAVVGQLADWLETLGWRVEVVPLPHHSEKANLIARLGSGEDGLVLAGHTDTVPWDEGLWRFPPLDVTVHEGRLYGLGTADMKGFLALVVDAVRNLSARDLKRPVTIVATADEETSMTGARAIRGALGRYCVIGEPTGLVPVHRHKGILMEAIRLSGAAAHSSAPAAGNSALEGMIEVAQSLMAFRDALQRRFQAPDFAVPVPTLNLGAIRGGDSPNRVCARCELKLDLRLLPGMALPDVRHNLRERVRTVAARRGLEVAFEALFEGIPALDTPNEARLVRLLETLTQRRARSVAFGTEGPYYRALGMETVVCGPGDIAQAHRPDEYLSESQIPQAVHLIQRVIQAICIT